VPEPARSLPERFDARLGAADQGARTACLQNEPIAIKLAPRTGDERDRQPNDPAGNEEESP
jgi:hypothetical protein